MYLLNRELSNLVIIYLLGFFYWLTLVFWREYTGKDVLILRKEILLKCNGWCVSHFFHYLILGYLAPSYWVLIIFIGFLFEIAEMYMNQISSFIDSKIIEDNITNTLGVITGVILYKLYPNKIDIKKMIKLLFNKITNNI